MGRTFHRVFPHFYETLFLNDLEDHGGRGGDEFENIQGIWMEIDVLCECAAILGMVISLVAAR